MICPHCGHPVTKQQLDRNEATKTGRDRYAHFTCIDNHKAGDPVFTTGSPPGRPAPVTNPS